MFDIGWTELLVIAVVAIIIVGPKDLPGMLRTLGRYAGKLKRAAGDFRDQFDDALRESELKDLQSTVSDIGSINPVNEIRDSVTDGLNPLKETAAGIKDDIEKPGSGNASGKAASGSKTASAKSSAKPRRKASGGGKRPAKKKSGGAKKAAGAGSEG